jgi:hypothetical protein
MSTSMTPVGGTVALERLADEMTPACEYCVEHGESHRAKWILFRSQVKCCPRAGAIGLACDGCKDARLHPWAAVECPACGFMFAPAGRAYSRIERLDGSAL